MIELQKLTLRPGESEKKLRKLTEKALRLQPEEILTFEIAKKSLDARKKRDIHYVYAVHLTVAGDEAEIAARDRHTLCIHVAFFRYSFRYYILQYNNKNTNPCTIRDFLIVSLSGWPLS